MRQKGNRITGKEYYFEENMRKKIEYLAKLVYDYGNEKQKLRAALYQIFHHGLHGRYSEGKDLFVFSKITLQHLHDINLQILYNRAIVQLGLASFQIGQIENVLDWLGDIVASNRLKELLAQGILSRKDKTTKQEIEEKKRLLPYHMHINMDVIETVYLISAMLMELPLIARLPHFISEFALTRHFRKVMQDYERKNVLFE